MRFAIKTVCVLLAASMLCACGDDSSLHRIDNSSSEAEAVTTTTAVTASAAVTATAKKTTATTKKKKKSNEIQMVPDGFYDITPIIEAHKSGDLSDLDPMQDAVLEAALEFIEDCDGDNMTKAEKELAVHDKMIEEIEYDSNSLDPLADHDKDSETPYGALINKKAICSGYALTFNLLTQLMGIESITVEGERKDEEPHLWNQVKLGQDWYCVDVTWDRNSYDDGGLKTKHKYFNCTAELMKTTHKWDEADYPAAKGTKYSYIKMKMEAEPYYAYSIDSLEQLLWLNAQNGLGELVFIPSEYYFDPTDPSFAESDELKEIKDMLIENDCWYLETITEETSNGTAAMLLYRTIKEEERPKEESSSEESSDSESKADSSSESSSKPAEGSSSKADKPSSKADKSSSKEDKASSSKNESKSDSSESSDSSSESDDTSSVSETEEKTEQ